MRSSDTSTPLSLQVVVEVYAIRKNTVLSQTLSSKWVMKNRTSIRWLVRPTYWILTCAWWTRIYRWSESGLHSVHGRFFSAGNSCQLSHLMKILLSILSYFCQVLHFFVTLGSFAESPRTTRTIDVSFYILSCFGPHSFSFALSLHKICLLDIFQLCDLDEVHEPLVPFLVAK